MRIEIDALIVGSGSAGLTAALTSRSEGLETLVIEKTDKIGGTTAYSGGVMWVPNNHLMEQAGLEDSTLRAMDYLRNTVGNRVSEERLLGFVENAPRMLKKLTDEGCLQVEIFEGFPDYRAEVTGGVRWEERRAKVFQEESLEKNSVRCAQESFLVRGRNND